jgi:hypothetical protein
MDYVYLINKLNSKVLEYLFPNEKLIIKNDKISCFTDNKIKYPIIYKGYTEIFFIIKGKPISIAFETEDPRKMIEIILEQKLYSEDKNLRSKFLS